jgi:hypothetical protein
LKTSGFEKISIPKPCLARDFMPFLYSVNTEYKRLKMAAYPEWVTAHRQKGTEIRHIKGQYYVYEVSSKWNPDKKRAQKITGKLIGKITPEGFIGSSKEQLRVTSQG